MNEPAFSMEHFFTWFVYRDDHAECHQGMLAA